MTDDVISKAQTIIKVLGSGMAVDVARALLAATERAEKAEADLKYLQSYHDGMMKAANETIEIMTACEAALREALSDLLRDAASERDTDWWASLQRAHKALENASPVADALIEVVKAVRNVELDARNQCGGDGLGCESMRGYYKDNIERRWRKCGSCPMDLISDVLPTLRAYYAASLD